MVRLDAVGDGCLHISGIDLLDCTPVLDIKPYVPYADSVADAHYGLADSAPRLLVVEWHPDALTAAQAHAERLCEPVVALIEQCLSQDPKPAYQMPAPEREYGVHLWDLNISWHYPCAERIRVLSVTRR